MLPLTPRKEMNRSPPATVPLVKGPVRPEVAAAFDAVPTWSRTPVPVFSYHSTDIALLPALSVATNESVPVLVVVQSNAAPLGK